jgi:outer membrane receptor for monomeric catechols
MPKDLQAEFVRYNQKLIENYSVDVSQYGVTTNPPPTPHGVDTNPASEQNSTETETETETATPPPKKSKGKYPAPSLEQVIEYFQSKGYSAEAAKKAWEYYEAGKDPTSGNWKDAHGNIVKAWKQKMIGVWFKPENKMKDTKNFNPEEERKRLEDALS